MNCHHLDNCKFPFIPDKALDHNFITSYNGYGIEFQKLGGYVYDEETQLYYLRSRYYNPNWCRFINADSIIDMKLLSATYAYCKNSPIVFCDHSGNFRKRLYEYVEATGADVDPDSLLPGYLTDDNVRIRRTPYIDTAEGYILELDMEMVEILFIQGYYFEGQPDVPTLDPQASNPDRVWALVCVFLRPGYNYPAGVNDLIPVWGYVSAEFIDGPHNAMIMADEVNVREGPGKKYDRIVYLNSSDPVYVFKREGEWCLVDYGDGLGWVDGDFIGNPG